MDYNHEIMEAFNIETHLNQTRAFGAIANLRLSRSELNKRRSRKNRERVLGLLAFICCVVFACVLIYEKPQALPATPEEVFIEAESEPEDELEFAHDIVAIVETTQETDVRIDWRSYYVMSDSRVPVHFFPIEASDIVGSIEPGAVVYGFEWDDGWTGIADVRDTAYYVKSEYLKPFGKEMSAILFFDDEHERISGGFTVNTNIKSISGLSIEDIAFLLKNYPGLSGIEEQVLLCERIYGVNAYFILGVASQESGFGSSKLATRKNNLFGIGAYDDSAFESGLSFLSKSESVEYFCALMARYYSEGRKTPAAINHQYATDELWARKVNYIMNSYAAQIRDKGRG